MINHIKVIVRKIWNILPSLADEERKKCVFVPACVRVCLCLCMGALVCASSSLS